MQVLTPSRVIAAAALALATLSFGVAYASTSSNSATAKATKKACVHGTALLERNKSNVVAFYTRAFNDKEPEDAVDKYVGFDKPGEDLDESGEEHLYIQHNPLAESGAPAFIAFVQSFTAIVPQLPRRHQARRRRVRPRRDARQVTGAEAIWPIGAKVVDIFRLDENGKIVEHWDVLAPLSPTSENGNPEV